ncbi:MAG: acyl-CoA reductase, partial [Bacteroidetes bacterium]
MSGNKLLAKLSSDDNKLLPAIAEPYSVSSRVFINTCNLLKVQ